MFGWLSRWMFEELRETHNFGYGDNACVPVQLLSRMESLKSLSPKTKEDTMPTVSGGN
jgi:hypothetical protein